MPLEGIVYGEVSGWLTIIGILVAIAGIIIGVYTFLAIAIFCLMVYCAWEAEF